MRGDDCGTEVGKVVIGSDHRNGCLVEDPTVFRNLDRAGCVTEILVTTGALIICAVAVGS